MSVDTVNYALTTVRRSIIDHPDNYSVEGRMELLAMCACMRDYLMQEDIAGFDRYVDSRLAKEPDAMSFLLEELFNTLGIEMRGELEIILDAA